MKRRFIVFLISTAIAMALLNYFQAKGSLFPGRPESKRLPEYSDPAKGIETTVGREFLIVLEANRTTGYGWQLANALDKKMLKVVEIKHKQNKTKRVGEGGKDLWTFRTLQAGETTIAFEYVRPWEKDVAPVKKEIFTVTIKK